MLSDLLAALHLFFNCFQLLQWEQEVMVLCDFFFVDNFLCPFKIDYNENAPGYVAGKLEVLVVCIEVDEEHLGEIDMAQRLEGKVSLLP